MKKFNFIFMMVGLCAAAIFAQNSEGESSMENRNVFGTIVNGFAESTRTINEINREHMAAVKADSIASFQEATAPDPGLVKFREAQGFGNKVRVIFANIRDTAKANAENEKARRAEIQSHESYKKILTGSYWGI